MDLPFTSTGSDCLERRPLVPAASGRLQEMGRLCKVGNGRGAVVEVGSTHPSLLSVANEGVIRYRSVWLTPSKNLFCFSF